MKRFVFLFFLSATAYFVQAQDQIILLRGDTLKANISKATPEQIEFTYPGETSVNIEYRANITKIIYASGREESAANTRTVKKLIADWHDVEITEDPREIEGLEPAGEVIGTSQLAGSTENSLGYKDAIKKLQKRAARKQAFIVLITDRPYQHQVRSQSGVRIKGMAYK